MNAAWVKYLPEFIREKLENRHGLQSILANAGWLFVDKILRMGVGLFVGVWIARYLGPEQFGIWNFAVSFSALFGAFAMLGLDGFVIRELVKHPERQNALLGSAFFLKLVGATFALLFSVFAISWLRRGETLTIWLVSISAAGFIFQSMNVIDFYFQARGKSKFTVLAASTAFLLATGAKIFLLLASAPLIAFAWIGLAEIVLTAFFLVLAYGANHLNIRDWRCEYQVIHQLLKESWPLILAGMAVMLYMRIDVVMLKEMVGDREVGIYSAATRIAEIFYVLPTVIVLSASPSIIDSHANNTALYIGRLHKLYFFMAWLAVGISLSISLFANQIVGLLYGPDYAEAVIVLAIHVWASAAVFLGVASSQYLLVEQLQKISLLRTTLGLICNILLNLALIPRFGAVGAAVATVVSYFIATFSLILFKATRGHAIYMVSSIFTRNRV